MCICVHVWCYRQGNMLQVFKWGMNFNWKMTDNDIFSVLCVPECVICTHMLYVDFEVAETNCGTLLPISLTLYLCNADFLFLVHIAHKFYHCRYFWHLKAYETKWVLYCNFDIFILCVCIYVCMYCTNISFLCLFCVMLKMNYQVISCAVLSLMTDF